MSKPLLASLAPTKLGSAGGHRPDRWFSLLTRGFALLVVALFAGMLLQLTFASGESIEAFGLGFIVSSEWNPVTEEFGALPFVYGTLASSLLALLLAVPVGIGSAIFLVEMAPRWLLTQLGFLIELLAAIPSVVYGLWGIFVLAPLLRESVQPALGRSLGFLPLFAGPPSGYGLMAAGIVLAIMILPTIASVSREVLGAVPRSLREVGLSLGATRAEVIWKVVLPTARSGLVGAVILGLGRALGETMAVTMLIGNRPEISASLFAPSYSMASVIANEFTEATATVHLAALAEIGLLLLLLTVILNVVARVLVIRVSRQGAR